MALGGIVLGSLILYLQGMRIMMFQLSGFYCRAYVAAQGLGFGVWIGLPEGLPEGLQTRLTVTVVCQYKQHREFQAATAIS